MVSILRVVSVLLSVGATMPAHAATAEDLASCQQTGDLDRSIAACSRVIDDKNETDSDRATMYLYRGTALMTKGSADKAIDDFDHTLALDPGNVFALVNRSLAHEQKGEHDRALVDLESAARLDPSRVEAMVAGNASLRSIKPQSMAPAQSDFAAALSGFTKDSPAETNNAILAVAATGNPVAAQTLDALQNGALFFTATPPGVYRKLDDGSFVDAASGTKLDPAPDGLKAVRLNNRVRGTLAVSLGTLSLVSPDPLRRLAAANEVFKSRDPAALPIVTKVMAGESDAAVKAALVQAQAALLLAKADAPQADRLAAVDTIRARGDSEALSLLAQVANSGDEVGARAKAGVASIQTRLTMWNYLQNVWYGLSLGSVLLLAAIGLAITFGVMGVINMAHGEMVMIGAYVTYVVQEQIRQGAPGLFGASLFIAIPLAFCVTGAFGILIERCIIRFLYGRPLETLLATFGLSLILQQLIRSMFGPSNREVGAPGFMSGTFDLGGLSITYGRMWIIVFALLVFAALQLLLRTTSFGLRMRAVTQNRRMASAMGIDTNRVDALAFGLGSGIAGIAGVALSQIDNVSPNLGQNYIIDSFLVVVFGGVGNLWGTLVAAATLGVANKLLEPIAGAVLGKIALLIFVILFIQKRPRGLFALKGRAVEA